MKKNVLVILYTVFFVPFLMAQQIENPGFEDWEEIGFGPDILEPVNWSSIKTSDLPELNNVAPIVWERSTDAHSGQYCLKLYNVNILGLDVVGTMCNGQIHADWNPDLGFTYTNPDDPQWHTPFTSRPDSIAFWLKFFPAEGDTLQFQALLHVGDATIPPTPENEDNWVGFVKLYLPEAVEEWTRIVLPFEYYDERTPEYILFILNSGNGTTPIEGSIAYYDDMEIIGGEQSIHDNPLNQVDIHVSENTVFVNNIPEDLLKQANLEILDLTGRSVWQSKINSNKVSMGSANSFSGIYIVKITSADFVISRKVFFN